MMLTQVWLLILIIKVAVHDFYLQLQVLTACLHLVTHTHTHTQIEHINRPDSKLDARYTRRNDHRQFINKRVNSYRSRLVKH